MDAQAFNQLQMQHGASHKLAGYSVRSHAHWRNQNVEGVMLV